MKVHYKSLKRYPDFPAEVPDGLLCEGWAKHVHDQSLDQLNERGGMTIGEMLINVHRKSPFASDHSYLSETVQHVEELKKLIEFYNNTKA